MSTFSRTILALLLFLVLPGALVQAEQPAIQIAKVKAVKASRSRIDPVKKSGFMKELPLYLDDSTLLAPIPSTNKLSATVETDGLLLLKATWQEDNSIKIPAAEKIESPDDLKQKGWEPIAEFELLKRKYALFRRIGRARDAYEISTNNTAGPRVFLPAPGKAAEIMAMPVIKLDVAALVAQPARTTPLARSGPAAAPSAANKPAPPIATSPAIPATPPDPNRKLVAAGTLALISRDTKQVVNHGLLLREIGRQAMLIAARDELNLTTRDQDLREELVVHGGNHLPMDLSILVRDPRSVELHLLDWDDEKKTNIMKWMRRPTDLPEGNLIEQLVTHCEGLSRAEFVDKLKLAGMTANPPAKPGPNDLPAGLEEELSEMSIFTQYSALRRVHADIREKGETPQRLAALVRGYGNLSMQTDFFWSPAHKVFKARSLLYAERLFNRAPNTAGALWYRAYARATAGLHQSAINDLDAAKKVAKTKEPRWVEIIDAYCRFDRARLEAAAAEQAPTAKLATFLEMVIVEGDRDVDPIVAASQSVLKVSPDCFRALDLPVQTRELGLKRMTAGAGFQVMQSELHNRLQAIPGLPPEAKRIMDEYAATARAAGDKASPEFTVRRQLVKALLEAGKQDVDRTEPSWQVLGKLIDELSYLHVWRVIDVQRNTLSVPAGELVKEFYPLVEDHPYAEFINAHQDNVQACNQAMLRLAAASEGYEMTFVQEPIFKRLDLVDRQKGYVWAFRAHERDDEIYPDLYKHALQTKDAQVKQKWAQQMLVVSPYAPQTATINIDHNWEATKPRAAELEKNFGNNPLVLNALGRSYQRDAQLSDAERCFAAAAKVSPNQDTLTALAELYYAQKAYDKWLATLEKFLELPSYGLGPAYIRTRIARHFMHQRNWPKARDYANAAAESGAGWAMLTAAACAEAMQDWPTAEAIFKATAARYADSDMQWYFFCKRTGQGDFTLSHQLALMRVQQNEIDKNLHWGIVAHFRQLTKERDKALEIYQENFQRTNDPMSGLFGAIVADQLKQNQTRDQLLAEVATKGSLYKPTKTGPQRKEVMQLAAILEADLKRGGNADFDVSEVDKLLTTAGNIDRRIVAYLAGCYLAQRSKIEPAVKLWKQVMADPDMLDTVRTLTGAMLLEHGVSPSDYKAELHRTDPKGSSD